MSVKLINTTDVKPRAFARGKLIRLPEFNEAWAALSNLPQGRAIEVALSDSTLVEMKRNKVEKPAAALAASFRRRFAANGLPFDAYASDDKTMTIVREIAPRPKKEASKK